MDKLLGIKQSKSKAKAKQNKAEKQKQSKNKAKTDGYHSAVAASGNHLLGLRVVEYMSGSGLDVHRRESVYPPQGTTILMSVVFHSVETGTDLLAVVLVSVLKATTLQHAREEPPDLQDKRCQIRLEVREDQMYKVCTATHRAQCTAQPHADRERS